MLNDWIGWFWRSRAYQSLIVSAILGGAGCLIWAASRREYWHGAWRQVRSSKLAMVCLLILSMYIAVGLLDSFSWSDASRGPDGDLLRDKSGRVVYEPRALSLLDRLCTPLRKVEKTYSAPLATRLFSKETMRTPDGRILRDYPRLIYGGAHLDEESDATADILRRIAIGLLIGLLVGALTAGVIAATSGRTKRQRGKKEGQVGTPHPPVSPSPRPLVTPSAVFWGAIAMAVVSLIAAVVLLAREYHVLGTDKVGNDVLYRSLKSVRTALIIGGFTTALAVPFAIFFGVIAGYFGGRIDDVIQYIYTTLASIPGILLIVAFMLLFGRGLFNLCLIMGITTWTGLCRLLRGETLKLRELEYVQAAKAFGVGRARIIIRHIIPNTMHIVLISFLLRFSGLVLAEALLSYLQIGVEPTRASWGSMIDIARTELAREPVVWWTLSAAFIFMVVLVLSVNLFGDAVRDALDPRLRTE
jgi:peptide/nickel transport system permease protein